MENSEAFYNADPLKDLTPSQDSFEYIYTIQSGHLKLFTTVFYQEYYRAVRAAFRRSSLFHLLVRRLLLIISREVYGYADGLELAKYCKGILDIVCELALENPEVEEQYFMKPLPAQIGKEALSKTAGLKSFEELQPVLQTVFNQL
jgi:hypothetical protein